MLITQKIADTINEQIGNELAASIQYVAIAAYFTDEGLPELAGYFQKQSDEERMHALKFVQYLGDTASKLEIPAIPKPICKFKSVEDAIELSYNQEVKVTKQIEAILKLALEEKSYLTQNFLQWFLTEQLEEVSSMDNLLKIVRLAGPDNLLHIEQFIARRGHPEEATKE